MPEEPNAPSEAASEDDAPRSLDSQRRACSVCQVFGRESSEPATRPS